MATLGDLKDRIALEMVRDDLSGDLASLLALHITRACEYFANEQFWFNQVVATASTVSGTQTVSVPATVRRIDRLTIPAEYTEVRKVGLAQFEQLDGTQTGVPTIHCHYNDEVMLYPTPDAVYSLQFSGLKQIDAPSSDSDTTVWTDEAYDLITGQVKLALCRGVFRDPEGAQMAMGEVQDALSRLRAETGKRLQTPLRAKADGPHSLQTFNVNAG